MSRILVAAELKTTSKEASDQVVDALDTVSKFSKPNEPGVLKYMICVPADSTDQTTVWALEEYADQAALDSHMASDPVKELISFMSTQPVLIGAPFIRTLSYFEGMEFAKAEAGQLSDPHIVFGDIEYAAGERDGRLQYWKDILQTSQEKSGCSVYGLAKDEAKSDTLYTLEVYESEKSSLDIRAAPSTAQVLDKTTGSMRSMQHTKLQLRGGYVTKSSP